MERPAPVMAVALLYLLTKDYGRILLQILYLVAAPAGSGTEQVTGGEPSSVGRGPGRRIAISSLCRAYVDLPNYPAPKVARNQAPTR